MLMATDEQDKAGLRNSAEFRALADLATVRAKHDVRHRVSPDTIRWHVVHNAAASDTRALQILKRSGFDYYYPHIREMRMVPKRELSAKQRNSPFAVMRPVPVPLFPRYVFVHFSPFDPNWHDVFLAVGIQGVLCDGSSQRPQPAPIADAVVKALMMQEIDGAIPAKVTIKRLAYEIGEQVRISTGAFTGHNGTVDSVPDVPLESLDESVKVRLLVSLFGRQSVVVLSLGDIEKL